MNVSTMVAINNLNMVTMMTAIQASNGIIIINDSGKEWKDMDGSMLDAYMGRD